MRLIQKSFLHTGYFVLKTGEIRPAFSSDLVEEAMRHPFSKDVKGIYGTFMNDRSQLEYMIKFIKKFKEKYGVIPQNCTEELRTGFFNNGELTQTLPRFCYK